MPTENATKDLNLREIAARTGQTPREIIGAGQMEGQYFPTGPIEGSQVIEELDELYNALEDYIIQQEALISVLESKGIINRDDVDQAIRTILETEDNDML